MPVKVPWFMQAEARTKNLNDKNGNITHRKNFFDNLEDAREAVDKQSLGVNFYQPGEVVFCRNPATDRKSITAFVKQEQGPAIEVTVSYRNLRKLFGSKYGIEVTDRESGEKTQLKKEPGTTLTEHVKKIATQKIAATKLYLSQQPGYDLGANPEPVDRVSFGGSVYRHDPLPNKDEAATPVGPQNSRSGGNVGGLYAPTADEKPASGPRARDPHPTASTASPGAVAQQPTRIYDRVAPLMKPASPPVYDRVTDVAAPTAPAGPNPTTQQPTSPTMRRQPPSASIYDNVPTSTPAGGILYSALPPTQAKANQLMLRHHAYRELDETTKLPYDRKSAERDLSGQPAGTFITRPSKEAGVAFVLSYVLDPKDVKPGKSSIVHTRFHQKDSASVRTDINTYTAVDPNDREEYPTFIECTRRIHGKPAEQAASVAPPPPRPQSHS